MKNPLPPELTAGLAAMVKDPKFGELAGAAVRDVVLMVKLSRAAKAGNVARCVWLGTMLITSSISDAERRLRTTLEPPKSADPFADLITRAAAQARQGRA